MRTIKRSVTMAAGLCIVALLLAASRSSQAFVPLKTTENEVPYHWKSDEIRFAIAADGSVDLDMALIAPAVQRSLDAWNNAIQNCSDVHLTLDPTPVSNRDVAADGVNLILFRDSRWCKPATATAAERCYAAGEIGITTPSAYPNGEQEGVIVDADIQFNAVNFKLAIDGASRDTSDARLSDFENTLVHELGHALGLGHTCTEPGFIVLDSEGQRVPQCGATDVSPTIAATTMYAGSSEGETIKRTPEADDVAGICAAHPKGRNGGGGGESCTIRAGNRTRSWPIALTVMALLVTGWRWRKTMVESR